MAAAKIRILKKNKILEKGRRIELEPELHYETWCDISSLYGKELYEALEKRLENTIIFKVRYCRKIKEIQGHVKDYIVEFEGDRYEIYATDYDRNEREYVQLKANRFD